MKKNNKNRCIYAYEFSDNHVYIGLTYDIKNRHNRHLNDNKSMVNIHISETNIKPELIQLTNYLFVDDAKLKENYYLNKYKKNEWIILNKAKTGSIGSPLIYWTKEKCQTESLKYKYRSEFYTKNSSAYSASLKNNWIDEVCSHMKYKTKKRGHWKNYDNCLKEAMKQKTKTKFRRYGSGAFNSSVKNGWKDKIYNEMNWNKILKIKKTINQNNEKSKSKPNGYWTKEKCHEELLKYKTKIEFKKKCGSAYNSSTKNKWIDEICSHMENKLKPNGYWTKEKCYLESLKYNTRIDFFEKSPGVYSKCVKNKWIDEICNHMFPKKLKNYWTKEKCIEESTKYNSRTEFSKKSSRAYQLCLKNKWKIKTKS